MTNVSVEAQIVDFAPHEVHYAGWFGDRWFVSLVQYPLLLVLDGQGNVVDRVAIPDVDCVVAGKIALRTPSPRVALANVQRPVDLGPFVRVAYDVATGREIGRDEHAAALLEDLPIPASTPSSGVAEWDGKLLSWTSGEERVRIAVRDNERGGKFRRYDWEALHWQDGAFVLIAPTRVLRVPLASRPEGKLVARVIVPNVGELPLERGTVFFVGPERVLVEHATRGRLWFDLPNSGLTKGDEVAIGGFLSSQRTTVATVLAREGKELQRLPPASVPSDGDLVVIGERASGTAAPPKHDVPEVLVRVAAVLADHGFIDRLSRPDLLALFEEVLEDEPDFATTTVADILLSVYADKSGAARGVVHHDHRFGNETDDVVAELTATLGDEPIAFKQTATRVDALQIDVGGRAHWVHFDRGGLDAIAHWINVRLAEAGARRRIFSVETLGDDHCYVVCSPDDVEAMRRRGVEGFGTP